MNLAVKSDAILHVTFDSQKELAMTMARVQEFYECNGLRGKAFDFEAFVDFYTADDGEFDYLKRVKGFNVPSSAAEEFFRKFELTRREAKLRQLTKPYSAKPYYLIATKVGDEETLDHELAHAHFYLNEAYQQKALEARRKMQSTLLHQIVKSLKAKQYADEVLDDEINAFMATSSLPYLRRHLKLDVTQKDVAPFKKAFSQALTA